MISLGSHAARWSIPGVGAVHPCIDRVVIVSSASVGRLMSCLPISRLKQASHAFDINTYQGSNPRSRSRLRLTGLQDAALWSILAKHECQLGRYSIMSVEFAFDVFTASEDAALKNLISLIGMLSKRNHQRGFLRCVYEPYRRPPPGLVSAPTYYFEDRKGGVNLKCYVRHEKLADGRFGRPIMRLEWTLRGKSALVRHLGGNQIGDLLRADLNGFLKRNLRLERVNHLALGKVLRGHRLTNGSNSIQKTLREFKELWADPNYWIERGAHLILTLFARREETRGHFSSEDHHAEEVCQNSPAQIRGYLRELRDGKPRNRGRPKIKPKIEDARSRITGSTHALPASSSSGYGPV